MIQVNFFFNFCLITALHFIVITHHMCLIKLLTSFNDIDLNCRDRYQRTPLHFASSSGILENVMFLTSLNGIDLNPVDKNVFII